MKCCGQEMRLAYDGGDKLKPRLVCLFCERNVSLTNLPQEEQAKLPHLDPGKQTVRVKQREKDIVESIRTTLLYMGYRVLRIGQYLAHKGGNDPGAPDLLVARPGSPRWLGMEVKRPGGARRSEQQELADIGCIVIVESVQEAIEAAEKWLEEEE